LQTPWNSTDQTGGTLYDKVRTLTSKPLKLVLGHAHGDHIGQSQNFLAAGVPVYANHRSWNGFSAVLASRDLIRQVNNVEEGDRFELGTAAVPLTFEVWALPGHENSLVMIHDKVSGFLFSTDFYGCTRMGSADNVGISGVRADLLLSLLMQANAGYLRDGGRLTRIFTGHDEAGLPGRRPPTARRCAAAMPRARARR
jgi:glyoxylase-like metal-dependent hydrolase (beta-lactamase superfamily II)